MTAPSLVKRDLTRTFPISKSFVMEFRKLFNVLLKDVQDKVSTKDAFGLKKINMHILNREYAGFSDAHKLEMFLVWIAFRQSEIFTNTNWFSKFLERAYNWGVQRAILELQKMGRIPDTEEVDLMIATLLSSPVHAERLRLLSVRVMNEIKGVLQATNQTIGRTVSDGLSSGVSPRSLSASIKRDISKIAFERAKLIAMTEVVRAHHQATVLTYQATGINRVQIIGSFDCPNCESFEGQSLSITEASALIPLHPNCRCMILPVGVGSFKVQEAINTDKILIRLNELAEEFKPERGPKGFTGPKGKDGKDGKDGKNGKDGVDGKDGRNGVDGKDGKDGLNGQDGRDGKDGENGKDGLDGLPGLPGQKGKKGDRGDRGYPGPRGKDGKSGRDGRRGKDGRDGKDGETGARGEKGEPGLAPPHQISGKRIRFKQPSGEWGMWVDLAFVHQVSGGGGLKGGGHPHPHLPVISRVVRDKLRIEPHTTVIGHDMEWLADLVIEPEGEMLVI